MTNMQRQEDHTEQEQIGEIIPANIVPDVWSADNKVDIWDQGMQRQVGTRCW